MHYKRYVAEVEMHPEVFPHSMSELSCWSGGARRGIQPVSVSVTPVSRLNFTPHVPLSPEFAHQLPKIFLVNKSLGRAYKVEMDMYSYEFKNRSLSSYNWMVCCQGQIYSRGWSCGPSVEVISWSLRGEGREGGKMGEVWRWIYLAAPPRAPLPPKPPFPS